tara:strand:- start:2308 stop:2706 length:399 start_codon:yes stop_codon:yes gene_type:complete
MNDKYSGDDEYYIDTTGDCCVGDKVRFLKAYWDNEYSTRRNYANRPAGFDLITAEITKDSYGADKQQHTFTLTTDRGHTFRIKGRNLYYNGVWRKPWNDESLRHVVLDEKHMRGDQARAARDHRIMEHMSAH